MTPFFVLDLAPITEGSYAAQAFANAGGPARTAAASFGRVARVSFEPAAPALAADAALA